MNLVTSTGMCKPCERTGDRDRRVHLLIIDPQNDFCDLPDAYRPLDPRTGEQVAPALPVAGAHEDMRRLAAFIEKGRDCLSDVTVTLDSHHRVDVAHPTFWLRGDGGPVPPFTPITSRQVRDGEFHPRQAAALPRVLAYLDQLEALGCYTLVVWPVHCEIGSWGHNVHADVRAAYNRWEEHTLRTVDFVAKGQNPWTEHYSAMQAEVPDEHDPDTQLNRTLIARLDGAELILVAGEASSHCVKATTEHLVENLPSGRREKVVLLTDCMSAVPGFEAQHDAFFNDIQGRGVVLSSSADMLRHLAP